MFDYYYYYYYLLNSHLLAGFSKNTGLFTGLAVLAHYSVKKVCFTAVTLESVG